MAIVVDQRFVVELLGLEHETRWPVRTEANRGADDPVPGDANRREDDSRTARGGKGRASIVRRGRGSTAADPEPDEGHAAGFEDAAPVHIRLLAMRADSLMGR